MKVKAYTRQDYIEIVGRAIESSLDRDCLIVFFGSILTERFSRTSDIDVGIYCREPLSGKEYVNIISAVENAPILRRVDLVDLATVKDKNLLSSVLERGRVWKGSKELLKDLKRRLESLKRQKALD